MRKRFMFVFLLIFSLLIVSCGDSKNDLDVPNVTLTGDVVSWNSIKDAKHYLLYIDEKVVKVETTRYNLADENLEEGTYNIYVVAANEDKVSAVSNQVNYVVVVAESQLDSPVVKLTDNVIRWDSVSNAESYIVKINGREITVRGTSYDLSKELLEPGTYDIKVAAVKDNNISLDSLVVKYYMLSEEEVDVMVQTLLKKVNQSYDLELKEEDFVDAFEFQDYLEALNSVNIYVNALIAINLNKQDAMNLFNELYDFFGEEPEVVDLDVILDLVDIFVSNNLTAEVAAKFIVKFMSSEDLKLPVEIQLLLEDYGLLVNDSLEIILSFVYELSANLPTDFVELINMLMRQEEIDFPLETIIRIKNETVITLESTLLTAEEFKTLYQLIWIGSAVINNNEITYINNELDYLSSLTHQALKVGLLFVKDVTAEDVENISILINDLMAEIDLNSQENINLPPMEKILDLLSFINNYVAEFTLNHQEEVLVLETLLNKKLTQPLYELFVKQIIDMGYPPRYYEGEEGEVNLNSYLKVAFINEYDSVIGIIELFKTLETDLLETIIQTNGSILNVILNANLADLNPLDLVNQILTILKEMEVYNDVLVSALSKDALEDILSVLIIPLMSKSDLFLEVNALEIETNLRELIPCVSQLLLNVLAVEKDIFKALKSVDFSSYMDVNLGYDEPLTLGLSIGIIHLLDEVLTVENKLLIVNSIDLIFDDILVNNTLQELLGLVGEDLNDYKVNYVELTDYLYSEIEILTSFDYKALDLEQEKAIISFLIELGIIFNIDTMEETNEDAMNRAIPLELGTEKEVLYKTNYLVFSYTAEEKGNYELLIPYLGCYFYVNIKDSSFEFTDSYSVDGFDRNNSYSLFLDAGETCYIVLYYDFNIYYENVKVQMTKTVYESLALEMPIIFTGEEAKAVYEFRSKEANLYQLSLTADDFFEGFVIIKDENNEEIYSHYYTLLVGDEENYYFYLKADQLVYFNFIRHEYNHGNLNVSFSLSDSLGVIGEDSITVNANVEKEMFHFIATEEGFYNLELKAITPASFYLELYNRSHYASYGNFYFLEIAEVESVSVYLKAYSAIIVAITEEGENSTFTMSLNKLDVSSLSVLEVNQIVNETIILSKNIDYKFFISEAAIYTFSFQTYEINKIKFVIYNNQGDKVEEHFITNPDEVRYVFEMVLSPGEYYLDLELFPKEDVKNLEILIGLEHTAIEDIILNVPLDITLAGEVSSESKTVILFFTPEEDGVYLFTMTTEGEDVFWYIDGSTIEDPQSTFNITWGNNDSYGERYLEGNRSYFIYIYIYDFNTFNLTVEKVR